MATRTVRVIRTWDFVVPAEYGDSDDALELKVDETMLDNTEPHAESRVLLPTESAS